jgi:PIN domain nuclease of toxin-antitoxin system
VRFLLDTCAVLWLTLEPLKIPNSVRQYFQEPENRIYLSVVSAREIAIKDRMAGRLRLPSSPENFLSECISGYDLSLIDIELRHALRAGALPLHHKDPFDRMLIAQAQVEDLVIFTPDHAFTPYEIKTLW